MKQGSGRPVLTVDTLQAFDRIGEALKASGISLEELLASGREFRAEIVRERYGLAEAPASSASPETSADQAGTDEEANPTGLV